MSPRTATLIGLTAILMWSLLAVLTVATGKIPAFQLAAMTFAIGAVVAFASFLFRPSAFAALKQPPIAWIVGVGGLFGYHALYFLALRFAPPAEAGLLNYLWPLLIVLFSSLLPGERLLAHHILGALLGLIFFRRQFAFSLLTTYMFYLSLMLGGLFLVIMHHLFDANWSIPIRRINENCYATIGQVGNTEHENVVLGKAGRSRHLGIRPINRGVSRNPVDHPNGGGAGKSKSGGGWQQLTSPWGLLAKGYRTREKKKHSNRFILVRRDGRPMKNP